LISDLTSKRVAAFARELRKPYERNSEPFQRSESTIACSLRNLRVVARWGHRHGYLNKVPVFDMPKGVQRMKGRPIATEEFERMLAATAKVVGVKAAESWKLLLEGIWWSGLRLGESMALRWDHQPGGVFVMLNGKKSVLAFDTDSQKSGKVQLVPLAPEAVRLLEPLQESSGYVFKPRRQDGLPLARDAERVGKIIGQIGRKAQVLVDNRTGKNASAHDLRRAFGFRWSRRVMPPQLQELMRHASIETTMRYYVGQNAEATAQELWDAIGTHSGTQTENSRPQTPENIGF
jgi:integrase